MHTTFAHFECYYYTRRCIRARDCARIYIYMRLEYNVFIIFRNRRRRGRERGAHAPKSAGGVARNNNNINNNDNNTFNILRTPC